MKKIDNYNYDINKNGDLTIYTEIKGRSYIISTLEDCLHLSRKAIRELIEEVLTDLGYELREEVK